MNAGLTAAYSALQAGDAAEALALLEALPPLVPADEARRRAWQAQALRAVGRAEEGAREVIAAIRIAKALGDADGVAALRALHTDLARSVASLHTAEEGRLRDQALLAADDATLDNDGRLRRAFALLTAGRRPEASALVRRVATEATELRDQVLSRLALARMDDDEAALHEAHTLADDADDHNLLTAVAQTARQLGKSLRAPEF
ncbi:MAG: hypothetical protein EXR71_15750 [Myxococcales bacterium]|nr:hypothetical protein [Myxococcales bacterium]